MDQISTDIAPTRPNAVDGVDPARVDVKGLDPARFDALLDGSRARERRALIRMAIVGTIVLVSFWLTQLFDFKRLAEGIPAILQIGSEMMPPDFTRWQAWLRPLLDTLAMSIAGTAFAVIFSIPLAFLAATNTTPNKVVYHATRLLLNLFRSIPELIKGIILVAAVGFGVLPGVLALGLHSIGMVGKFFAEAIEHVDPKPIEAARAAGATPVQVIWHAILPQVMPQMLDTVIYRWEYNFRASVVLGAVGAGGIGTELISSLRIMDYQQVAAILLCILACVTIVDSVGIALRRKLA
ncbi:MAG: phosphonate ABC transporter, permease protein PhnE [Proteobacteria bacterium]|nr:phosphonate ABC transporter, permease protein PhnE [Burkholderiales bacterium]